jgi:hypothetical protein
MGVLRQMQTANEQNKQDEQNEQDMYSVGYRLPPGTGPPEGNQAQKASDSPKLGSKISNSSPNRRTSFVSQIVSSRRTLS